MKQIKKILLCVHPDFTDLDMVDRTAGIANKTGASIRVNHVISDYPEDTREWWNVRNPEKLHKKIVAERQGFVDGIVQRVRDKGVDNVDSQLRWGRDFIEIIHEVLRNHYDLVVLTARHTQKLAKMMLECPSLQLMRLCPCNLWVTRGNVQRRTKRIAAALAGEGGRAQCSGLNAKILQTAALIAQAEDSTLHVVHALPVYGGKGVKGDKLRPDLAAYVEELRKDVATQCTPLVKESGVSVREENVHLVLGRPGIALPEWAKAQGVDLVVMGTKARSGVPGLLVGNTAEKIMDQLDCGVLVVKPDDFVSLVSLEEEGMEPPVSAVD
jgi:universal stress protein E